MKIIRVLKHLFAPPWIVRRAFPPAALAAIEDAIGQSERTHEGELRFAVEAGLDLGLLLRGQTARERAQDVFSLLRVWDTESNSGVLIYVQFVDHRIEIIADRGINAKVAHQEWEQICRRMESAFRGHRYEQGVLAAIAEVTALLSGHFPARGANPDELPDHAVIL